MCVVSIVAAAQWKSLSTVQKAPWKRLSEESLRQYNTQKMVAQDNTAHYSLTAIGLAAAAKLRKKTVTAATLAKTNKTSTKAKAPVKTGKAAKKTSVKKSTKNVKVSVYGLSLTMPICNVHIIRV